MPFTDVLSVLITFFFIKSLKPKEKAPFIIHLTGLATKYNKMQLDVKHVPKHCKHKNLPLDKKYYQYTIIDEASRKRFIYFF